MNMRLVLSVLLLALITGGSIAGVGSNTIFTDGFEDFIPPPQDFPTVTSSAQEPVHDGVDADAAASYPAGGSVVINNGEKRLDRSDLAIPGRGQIHFEMFRRYRSQLNYDGPLGFGWDFTYNERLSIQPNGDVIRANGLGHVDTWVSLGGGDFSAPTGYFGTLTKEIDDTYILRETNGFKRTYGSNGLLLRHEDRFGNAMLFSYDGQSNLSLITDVYGRDYELEYLVIAGHYRLITLRDFAGREVVYNYDSSGDLVSVRSPIVTGTSTGNDFPSGRTEEYTYSSGQVEDVLNHNLLTVTYPVEVALSGPEAINCVYGTSGLELDRVVSMTIGGMNASSGILAGGTATFAWQALNQAEPPGDPDLHRLKVSVTERNGNQREYFVNEREHVITLRHLTQGLRPGEEPPDYWETRFAYDADGQLTLNTFHEGNSIAYTYDTGGPRAAQRNLLEVRRIADVDRGGGEDLVTTYTYEPVYNLARTVTGPRGNAAGFTPPIGAASADRYTSEYLFDYQEHSDPVPDAVKYGFDLSGIDRGLGDLNSDGNTSQSHGNVVREEAPTVNLLPGSNEALRIGSTQQQILTEVQWNDAGQRVGVIDPEGNLSTLSYYPENDPDGDGNLVPGNASTAPRGYLESIVQDATPAPARRTAAALPAELELRYAYDAIGNIISRRNPRGVVTTFEMTALNELMLLTRGADVSHAVATDQLLTGESAFEYKTRFTYDANGRPLLTEVENRADVSTTDGVGDWVEHTRVYDILNNLLEASVEVGALTTATTGFAYDENELLVRVTRPEGNEAANEYDERNLLFRRHRGFGAPGVSITQVDYDGNGNVVRMIDAEDNDDTPGPESTLRTYDGFDRRISNTDPLGNQLVPEYDVASNIVRIKQFGHQAGNPTSGNVLHQDVSFSHDELRRVFQVDRELFIATGFTPVRTPDLRDFNSDGKVTDRVEYDALSRRTFLLEDDGDTSEITYDGVSRVVGTDDALANYRLFEYDQGSNLVFTVSAEYSPEGLVVGEGFRHWMVYDQFGRLLRQTDAAGRTNRFGYDSRNNLTTTSDGNGPLLVDDLLGVYTGGGTLNDPGNTATRYFDGRNLLIRQIADLRVDGQGGNPLDLTNPYNPDGQVTTQYAYDLNGRFSGLTDDNGNTTAYAYDALDRMVSRGNADLTANLNVFDRDHNLVTHTDFNGSVITNTFDALNRLIQRDIVRAPGLVGTTQETYGYDGSSRMTASSDDNGSVDTIHTVNFTFDSLSRIIEKQQDAHVISSTFSGEGNLERIIYPGDRVVEYTHDALNRIKQVNERETPESPVSNLAEYFWIGPCTGPGCDSRFLKLSYANGTEISMLSDAGDTDIGWNWVKEIRTMVYRANGVNRLVRTYEHDRTLHNRTNQTRLEISGHLGDISEHNSVYWLSRWTVAGSDNPADGTLQGEHSYDGTGNLRETKLTLFFNAGGTDELIKTNTVNERNQYVVADGEPYTYDNNGSLVNSHGFHQRHNYKNQLVRVERESDLKPFSLYHYNTLGERVVTELYELAVPGPAISSPEVSLAQAQNGVEVTVEDLEHIYFSFHYGLHPWLLEIDSSNPETRAVFTHGADQIILKNSAAAVWYWPDDLGHNISATDEAGNLIVYRTVEPWGSDILPNNILSPFGNFGQLGFETERTHRPSVGGGQRYDGLNKLYGEEGQGSELVPQEQLKMSGGGNYIGFDKVTQEELGNVIVKRNMFLDNNPVHNEPDLKLSENFKLSFEYRPSTSLSLPYCTYKNSEDPNQPPYISDFQALDSPQPDTPEQTSNPAMGGPAFGPKPYVPNLGDLDEDIFNLLYPHGIFDIPRQDLFGDSEIDLCGDQDNVCDYWTLPAGLIERLDVLKNGASAVYGAEPLAGLVNRITRLDFEYVTIDFIHLRTRIAPNHMGTSLFTEHELRRVPRKPYPSR